jgi:hypothetical protein
MISKVGSSREEEAGPVEEDDVEEHEKELIEEDAMLDDAVVEGAEDAPVNHDFWKRMLCRRMLGR